MLKLFLLHPDNRFYIRQLARGLKLQVNSVRRELENLEKFGLLVSTAVSGKDKEQDDEENVEKDKLDGSLLNKKSFAHAAEAKQEKKYYQVNKDFILFEEIKALIVKAQVLYEKDFVEKLAKTGKTSLLILSGLFVNNPGSPVDILMVGNFQKQKLCKLIKELEGELGRELNYTIMNRQEFKYRRDITDVFLYNILEGRKLIVINEVGLC